MRASGLHAAASPRCNRATPLPPAKRPMVVCQANPFAEQPSSSEPSSTNTSQPATVKPAFPYTVHKWTWRGHTINYATAGCGQPILLVHGFGASVGHYRKNIAELSKNYKVWVCRVAGASRPPLPMKERPSLVH